MTTRRRPGLAVFAGLVAVSAWGGAAGLLVGFLDLGAVVTARLPSGSPVLGGLALALHPLYLVVDCLLVWAGRAALRRRPAASI